MTFGAADNLVLAATEPWQGKYELSLFDCSGDCSAQSNWSELDGLWYARDELDSIRAEIASTATGKTRLAVRAHDPSDTTSSSATVASVLAYRGCDSACGTVASWTSPIVVPGPAAAESDVGFALALDGAAQPTIAFLGDQASGYATCTGDCTGASGLWNVFADVSADYLGGAFAPTVPASCTFDAWGMWLGPSLALDAQGKPIVAVTAQAKAFGGQCGTGSTAVTTDSFLSLP
jgi:hypothetical protein